MTYLLDTSAVLAHMREEPGAQSVQELFEQEDASIFLCSVTLAELARRLRALGARSDQAWALIGSYCEAVDKVVLVDDSVARESDRLSLKASARLPLVDALIAAAAQQHGAVLVHQDSHMGSISKDVLSQFDLSST